MEQQAGQQTGGGRTREASECRAGPGWLMQMSMGLCQDLVGY